MAKAQPTLADELASRLPAQSRPKWIARVPSEMRVEIESIKRQFLDGTLDGRLAGASRTGLAAAITSWVRSKGIAVHDITVARWLKK